MEQLMLIDLPYHEPINSTPVGQTNEVCILMRLMSGIDNLRPPTPKYNVIWEVGVIRCLKNLGEDEQLSNKNLTFKTVMLLALTAIKRCSELLSILDVRFMAVGQNKVIFQLAERPKNCRAKGKKILCLFLNSLLIQSEQPLLPKPK